MKYERVEFSENDDGTFTVTATPKSEAGAEMGFSEPETYTAPTLLEAMDKLSSLAAGGEDTEMAEMPVDGEEMSEMPTKPAEIEAEIPAEPVEEETEETGIGQFMDPKAKRGGKNAKSY